MQKDSDVGSERKKLEHIALRLLELNNTSTQILIFLSFGIVAAVTFLTSSLGASRSSAVIWALRWWIVAIFPTVLGIIPLKEIRDQSLPWYTFVLWMRYALMWCAIICIFAGAIQFFRAV